MNPYISAGIDPATGAITTGETVLFWVLTPIMVVAALGLLFAKKAVYAAVSVVFVMVCLAFIYTALEAPFLGVVQVIVYTGAIMMLFLFVLMLVGVDSSDSVVETIKGQKVVAFLAGAGLLVMLIGALSRSQTPKPVGLDEANAESNPVAVAVNLFGSHVLTMELTGALLITAALGAMVLTHKERIKPRRTQFDVAEAKMAAYAATGAHPGQKPNSGVYAESNSSANPALTAGGVPVEDSVSRILRIRGQARTVGEISPKTVERIALGQSGATAGLHGPATSREIHQSGMPGMPGMPAPTPPTQAEITSGKDGDDITSDEVPTVEESLTAEDIREAHTESEPKEEDK